jgi:hypothetical protein
VADLLECVIQIKALEHAIARLTRLLDVPPPGCETGAHAQALLSRLVDAERAFSKVWLVTRPEKQGRPEPSRATASKRRRRMRHGPRPRTRGGTMTTGASGDMPAALEEFVVLRRANLDVLGACTAAGLGSPVTWPGRRDTTVADLVAIMLAHDTEVIGQLRLVCGNQVARS